MAPALLTRTVVEVCQHRIAGIAWLTTSLRRLGLRPSWVSRVGSSSRLARLPERAALAVASRPVGPPLVGGDESHPTLGPSPRVAPRDPRPNAAGDRALPSLEFGARDDVAVHVQELLDGGDDAGAEAVGAPGGLGDVPGRHRTSAGQCKESAREDLRCASGGILPAGFVKDDEG